MQATHQTRLPPRLRLGRGARAGVVDELRGDGAKAGPANPREVLQNRRDRETHRVHREALVQVRGAQLRVQRRPQLALLAPARLFVLSDHVYYTYTYFAI